MNYRLARLLIFLAGALFLALGTRFIYLKITQPLSPEEVLRRAVEARERDRVRAANAEPRRAARRPPPPEKAVSPSPVPTPAPLAILTETLPMAVVGEEYAAALQARGAVGDLQWSLAVGEMPPGLALSAEGKISGTPEAEGEWRFTVTVRDPVRFSRVSRALVLLVRKGEEEPEESPLEIVTGVLPDAVLGREYLQVIEVKGGQPPYAWELVGSVLPRVLLLNKEAGAIYGMPRETGTFRFTIRVTDSREGWVETNYTLVVKEEGLEIVTAALPPAARGQEYSVQLTARGGVVPYRWELVSGNLPEEFKLDRERGVIFGTAPLRTVTVPLVIRVSDLQGRTAERGFSLRVLDPNDEYFRSVLPHLNIATQSLPSAVRGQLYSAQLQAVDGLPPLVWTVSRGELPPHLSLGSGTGTIAGIPEKEGEYTFTVLVSDENLATAQAEFTLTVGLQLVYITTGSLSPAVLGQTYQEQLAATGGAPPYRWELVYGSLPPDLALDSSSGAISGLVLGSAAAQEIVLRIKVTDSSGLSDIAELRLQVRESAQPSPIPTLTPRPSPTPAPTSSPGGGLRITTSALPQGRVGDAYQAELSAAGGSPPYSWSVASLPRGLAGSANGAISGTPTEAGDFALAVTVRDSSGATVSGTVTLTVDEAYAEGVGNLIAAGGDGKVGLAWTKPADCKRIEVRRKTGSFPQSYTDGTLAYQGTADGIVDGGLSNGVAYCYAVIVYDQKERPSRLDENAWISGTPQAVTLGGSNDPYADEVVKFSPLSPGGQSPELSLGPPRGEGSYQGSLDVVSLHARAYDGSPPCGGTIVLKFSDNIVVNEPGEDFTVFENAFYIGGSPEKRWMEPAVVSVSQDGENFYSFPFDYVPHYNADGSLNHYNPYSYFRGFAGINPVFSNNGSPDPTNPSVSGGDSFDLSDVSGKDLAWIQYLKITSTGDNWLTDQNGDRVRQTQEFGSLSGSGSSGFDLDAACAIHY